MFDGMDFEDVKGSGDTVGLREDRSMRRFSLEFCDILRKWRVQKGGSKILLGGISLLRA